MEIVPYDIIANSKALFMVLHKAHLLWREESRPRPTSEELEGENSQGPAVKILLHKHELLLLAGLHSLWSSVLRGERGRSKLADLGRAPKVDERPAVEPRQPQDVARLDVTMRKAGRMQAAEPLRDVLDHL